MEFRYIYTYWFFFSTIEITTSSFIIKVFF
nr:MAG TPA: hypothetical protein [Bacteriophage sp.]